MAEMQERLTFMKAKVWSQVEKDPATGVVVCSLTIQTPGALPDVTVAWDPQWSRYGVYLNEDEVWPPADTDDNIHVQVHDDEGAGQ